MPRSSVTHVSLYGSFPLVPLSRCPEASSSVVELAQGLVPRTQYRCVPVMMLVDQAQGLVPRIWYRCVPVMMLVDQAQGLAWRI